MTESPQLEYDAYTGEPFLRLPHPYDHIIITPPRLSDASELKALLNDPKVYLTLHGPPFPYLEEHAVGWLKLVTQQADRALHEFLEREEFGKDDSVFGGLVRSCPVRYIRELHEDGTDVLLGDIDVHRCQYPDVEDIDQRERLSRENAVRELGDPELAWCIGCEYLPPHCLDVASPLTVLKPDFLASSHHGKGIMTTALSTIMNRWLVPQMGVRLIRVEVFEGNVGSVRVFEKNGFKLEGTVPQRMVTNSGVKVTGMHVLSWRA